MTVKKRLAISNIIMIIVPVAITAVIGLLCLGGVYITAHHSGGYGFEDTNDFYSVSQTLSGEMYEIFENDETDATDKLDAIANVINKDTMFISACKNGAEFYKSGNESLTDGALVKAAKEIGGNTFVSSEKCQLYYYTDSANGESYELYIYSTPSQIDNSNMKSAAFISVALVILAIFFSIFLTNRFLTRFALKKIEEPLELLSAGVAEISDGNLDYRIEYDGEDEFKPVCTAFNEMAARLKKSVELTQKNEQNRKELLLDISHDLRSPLTSIQAYVEGILDGVAQTPEMQRKYLETIKRKTTDIEKMVSSLFAYSKLDMEDAPLNTESISISRLISETAANLHDEYAAKGLEISVDIKDDLTVLADEEMLLRVAANLLDNSLKYKNKEVGRVLISVCEKDGRALVEFADDGPGVQDECYDKLFDIFYRTDKARSDTSAGSGIGLAFVKKAIELMNGRAWAKKSELGGLSIIVELEEQNGKNTDN